jgi:hypothetical protein
MCNQRGTCRRRAIARARQRIALVFLAASAVRFTTAVCRLRIANRKRSREEPSRTLDE